MMLKMISANEPEIASAVSLLLHEAALIDRYSTTASKDAARNIDAVVSSGWLEIIDDAGRFRWCVAFRSGVRVETILFRSLFRACR
jgi:hypothetical protein